VRRYYLFLRQHRKFGASAMKVAKCALRSFYREHLKLGLDWSVFEDLRIAPPQTLPLVLTRQEVAASLRLISQYLGHAFLETTLIYTHLTPLNEAKTRAALFKCPLQ
jgi:hypothetical protein